MNKLGDWVRYKGEPQRVSMVMSNGDIVITDMYGDNTNIYSDKTDELIAINPTKINYLTLIEYGRNLDDITDTKIDEVKTFIQGNYSDAFKFLMLCQRLYKFNLYEIHFKVSKPCFDFIDYTEFEIVKYSLIDKFNILIDKD